MHGYSYGYGYDPRVGQDYDPSPPRLQAYAKRAQSLVTAMAAQRPTTPFFVWILDADGREYVHPFMSHDEMGAFLRRKSQPSRNFYYMALFNRTGSVWPAPESTAYGCHAPEWNTWPSEFPQQPGPCPSTVSGWPAVGQTSSTPSAQLLAAVVAFINQGQAPGATSPSLSSEVLASLSAAARHILNSAHEVFYRDQPGLVAKLRAWAVGQFAPNEIVHPQLIAAQLLWAETWKQGS